ncbi:SIMPL domain-containing protein [Caulobacter sp. 602-2]|uniref:SIMPL domain-containing protein n=1 Tax=Caulobacter sp. 602-2 TaxID=2710887 RepID=A0A6G4QTB7_9CAUL|nr:SIMPL domain-containing protein [Caulobacter sp. 602-2]NGM48733.1 SIMPL domain-containing protein [Caulobacter sp. 602-2]
MIRNRSTVPALVAAGAAILALSAVPAAAQNNDAAFRATTFNLSAAGETAIAPDMATITLGVQSEGASAAAALSANGAAMNKVIAALKKAGVAERDIQTSNLNVNPQYAYEQNQPPRLTGYQASNQVTILARDLSKLGQTVDAAASAGANTVGGISFGLQNPQKAEDEARIKAVAALKAKSDLYARATGYKVVRLVSLNEAGGYTPSPQPAPMFAMAKREMADSTAISGGELKVRVEVSATYEAQQ